MSCKETYRYENQYNMWMGMPVYPNESKSLSWGAHVGKSFEELKEQMLDYRTLYFTYLFLISFNI